MNGPLKWFKFRNHDGVKWDVEVTSHEDSPVLKGRPKTLGYAGLSLMKEKKILIDLEPGKKTQDFITLHELMHAALDGDTSISDKTEEKVIAALAPRLFPILQQFGLKWPDKPAGSKQIEKKARGK